jgi:CDP-paratose 2-epimerase
VIGLDNDMRSYFFGPESTTRPTTERLAEQLGTSFRPLALDIRDADGVLALFAEHGSGIELVVHTAAQPSHDWAAREPFTDFAVNATGTLHLLEATRRHCPDATFVFCSTNKVYGDRPNALPLEELDTRLELPQDHAWYRGVDLTMPIDTCTHSCSASRRSRRTCSCRSTGATSGSPRCASAAAA